MHRKRKWIVWLSIFLSSSAVVLASVQPQQQEATSVVATAEPESLLDLSDTGTELITTTTAPPPPETVPASSGRPKAPRASTTTTAPNPEPVEVAPEPLSEIEEAICSAFGDACAKALQVAECESSFNPGTTGKAGERGLFQIHPVHRGWVESQGFSWDQMYEVGPNIEVAFNLWAGSGWDPWSCA